MPPFSLLTQVINSESNKFSFFQKTLFSNRTQNYLFISPNNNYYSQISFDYISEIWESLKDKEYSNNYNYYTILLIQNDINETMRSILIDWIVLIHAQLKLKQQSLFLSVNLIDRYLSKKKIVRSKFQLLGVTALFVACKYEEITYPHISIFVELTAKTFTKTEILEMESEILNCLSFELNIPSSINFLEILSLIYHFDEDECRMGCFMLEVFLLDIKCNKYSQSEIALGVCYILLKIKNYRLFEDWEIKMLLWENIEKIKDCARDIYYYLENKNNIKLRAVFNKYLV